MNEVDLKDEELNVVMVKFKSGEEYIGILDMERDNQRGWGCISDSPSIVVTIRLPVKCLAVINQDQSSFHRLIVQPIEYMIVRKEDILGVGPVNEEFKYGYIDTIGNMLKCREERKNKSQEIPENASTSNVITLPTKSLK